MKETSTKQVAIWGLIALISFIILICVFVM